MNAKSALKNMLKGKTIRRNQTLFRVRKARHKGNHEVWIKFIGNRFWVKEGTAKEFLVYYIGDFGNSFETYIKTALETALKLT